MNDAIKLAIKKGGYDFEKKENDGLIPPLKFSRSEFRIHSKYKELMVRALYLDAQGKEYGSWVRFEQWARNHANRCILDPLFWQALGKALGKARQYVGSNPFDFGGSKPKRWWKVKAHQYFDLVLTGGNTEKFWKELLNQ